MTKIKHHKDGNKYNNLDSNFEILNGQREHKLRHKDLKIDWNLFISKLLKQDLIISTKKLNEALDQFFTPCQKYIILRKAYDLPLAKTDGEYYSRVIKKKIKAIANPTLHKMAQFLVLEM